MNETKRAIHFEVTVSDEEMKRKFAETRQQLIDTGKTAEEEGRKIKQVFQNAVSDDFSDFSVESFKKRIAKICTELQYLGKTEFGNAMTQESKLLFEPKWQQASLNLEEKKFVPKTFGKLNLEHDLSFNEPSNQNLIEENIKQIEKLIATYQSYGDKRKKIQEDITKLEDSNKNGKYDANIAEAKTKMSELDFEEAKKTPDFVQLFGNIDNMALSSLKSLRDRIKTWMDDTTKELSPANFKAVSDAFLKLELKVATKDPFEKSDDSIRGATKKVKAAQVAYNKAKDEGGDTEGADKVLTQAQMQREMAVAKAQVQLSTAAEQGKQVVGAAKDVTNIMGDFGIKVPEEITGTIEGMGQMMEGLSGINITNPMSIVTGGIKALGGLVKTITSIFDARTRNANRIIKEEAENIKNIKKEYKDLERTIQSALGTDYYKKQVDSAVLLERQVKSIDNQIAAEESKRKRKQNEDQIDAWKEEQKDLVQQIGEIKQGVVDELATTDLKSYSMDLSNSLIEGLAGGIEDMGGVVDEKMDALLKNIIAKQFDMMVTQKAMAPMFEAMAQGFNAQSEGGFGLSNREMDEIVRQGNNGKEKITNALGSYTQMMDELGLINEEVSEAATGAKGEIMANMTEETGSELVGMIRLQVDKLHAIEFTNVSQFEFLKLGWQNIAEMARTNVEIAANTFRTANNTDCLAMSLSDMNTKLTNIEKNTKPTYSK